jgi:hypothetical protein
MQPIDDGGFPGRKEVPLSDEFILRTVRNFKY